jgi:hypothetical protein
MDNDYEFKPLNNEDANKSENGSQQAKGKYFDFDDEEIRPLKWEEREKKKKKVIEPVEQNPFKNRWNFPVSLSKEKYYREDDPTPRRLDSISEDDLEQIRSGRFMPYLLDETFARLFIAGETMRTKIYSLQGEGALLLYIIFNLGPGEHSIKLNVPSLAKSFGVYEATIYNYIKTLIGLDIISRTSRTIYHVNIQFFCQGKRGYHFPQYCYDGDDKYEDMVKKIQEEAETQFLIRKNRRKKN